MEQIRRPELLGPPGSRFDYGSTHLHVAGLMAQVAVGSDWNNIFDEQIRKPLSITLLAVPRSMPISIVICALRS